MIGLGYGPIPSYLIFYPLSSELFFNKWRLFSNKLDEPLPRAASDQRFYGTEEFVFGTRRHRFDPRT